MIFFDRLVSLFSVLQTHAHGPEVSRVQRGARAKVSFEPIDVQMLREMDEFDNARKGVVRDSDVAEARSAIRGGMPIRHVRSMYGEAVLERAQASLQTGH